MEMDIESHLIAHGVLVDAGRVWVDFKGASQLPLVWHLPLTFDRYFAGDRD